MKWWNWRKFIHETGRRNRWSSGGIKQESRKEKSDSEDLQSQLGNELADVIHYAVAIAALNGLDMNQFIIEKDKTASVKYYHRTNLEEFVIDSRSKKANC